MGIAAYNRGSNLIAAEADRGAQALSARADLQAYKDECARLRLEVAKLERELGRARRCIAAERYSREKRVSELGAELRSSEFAISTLCRVAFPADALSAREGR
jgi:hypothetical protein